MTSVADCVVVLIVAAIVTAAAAIAGAGDSLPWGISTDIWGKPLMSWKVNHREKLGLFPETQTD